MWNSEAHCYHHRSMFNRYDPNQDGADSGAVEIPAAAGLAVLLIGAALGAVAALLLAPKSGRDLRADLNSFAGDWKNQATERLTQGRDAIVNSVDRQAR